MCNGFGSQGLQASAGTVIDTSMSESILAQYEVLQVGTGLQSDRHIAAGCVKDVAPVPCRT